MIIVIDTIMTLDKTDKHILPKICRQCYGIVTVNNKLKGKEVF